MDKEEKRALFVKLLEARAHGEGPAKLAKWCGSSTSAVYLWKQTGGPWPYPEKEAKLWAYFGYTMDERGNPVGGLTKRKEVPSKLSAEKHTAIAKQFETVEEGLRSLAEMLNAVGVVVTVRGDEERRKDK
jgi:hypothetical protein